MQDPIVPAEESQQAEVSSAFDYADLDASVARSLRQRAQRISKRESRVVEDILANGREFAEARDELRHNKRGGFEAWLAHHGWSKTHAYRYIRVWQHFGNRANLERLEPSALFALAEPSTPEPARQEALRLADLGEEVSHSKAKQLRGRHPATYQPSGTSASPSPSRDEPAGQTPVPATTGEARPAPTPARNSARCDDRGWLRTVLPFLSTTLAELAEKADQLDMASEDEEVPVGELVKETAYLVDLVFDVANELQVNLRPRALPMDVVPAAEVPTAVEVPTQGTLFASAEGEAVT